jgi:hypothetical protein
MRELTLIVASLSLVGCNSPKNNSEIMNSFFPFADRPNEKIVLQHEVQVVKGEIFHFQQDGSRVMHQGLPVATIIDRNTFVISVSSVLDVNDFFNVSFDAEDDVKAIILAAEIYCEQTGYSRVGDGATIWVGENKTALVEFCVPNNVQLPASYVSGDRIPRAQ